VGLVAGRTDADLLTVTWLDLAARGWFRLTPGLPDPQAPAPAMCVLPAQTPVEDLTPYERRAITHLSRRVGPLSQIPAPALTDGFERGTDSFRQAFRREVVADARRLGLTRPTLSTARLTMLCLLALVPAGVALIASHPHGGRAFALYVFYWLILWGPLAWISSERLTPAGQQALAAWQAHGATWQGHDATPGSAAWASDAARAAALGISPEALAQFTPPGENTAWSGYGEGWRLVSIGDPSQRIWPGLSGWALSAFCLLTAPGIPLLAFGGYELAGGSGGVELGIVTGIALDALVLSRGISRWAHLPRFAEFDGMVLRQWDVDGDGDHGTTWYVAVDDGFRPQAWAFEVSGAVHHRLTPGTLVRVRIDPRLNKVIGIDVIRLPRTGR